MNLVLLMFTVFSISIILLSVSLLNLFENKLPAFFIKQIRYGKFAYKGKISGIGSKFILEVPKSWFKHFYCVGVFVYSLVLYQATAAYIFNYETPKWFYYCLTVACGTNCRSYIPAIKVYTALILMYLQVWRRFYDTHFISVFGKKAKINLSAYFVGLFHYLGSALAIMCEAPKFANSTINASSTLRWGDITYFDFLAIILFCWAWWHQHIATKILANLRKDKNGNTISEAHKIPQGDWFNYLSCPHQTAEILMYFSITILLWDNVTWFFVFLWVLTNQIITILLSHSWYQSTFKGFPKNRKALIPLVY